MFVASVLHVVVLQFLEDQKIHRPSGTVISIFLLQQVSLHSTNSTSLMHAPLHRHWIHPCFKACLW